MKRFLLFMVVVAYVSTLVGALAQEAHPAKTQASEVHIDDPRGATDLTICSQNLNNFGTYQQSKTRLFNLSSDDYEQKISALVKRFSAANCDCIAVQELLAKDEEQGKATLGVLAKRLRAVTGRFFDPYIGQSNEPLSRVGFLIARDRAEVQNIVSYNRVELPKLMTRERPRFFIRGPLEIQLSVPAKGEGLTKIVSLVNFHFKSKAGKGRDPAELEFETYRMQMAEALRRIVESRHAQSFGSGETILVLLGDRNSNFDTASASILEGSLTLQNFTGEGTCRLTKRGVPFCKRDVSSPERLFSVLTLDPQTKLQSGTFLFEGTYSWLDDIIMPTESLRYAWERFDSEGDYASGVVNEPKEASDHAMVYVRLNW